jgi:NCAIR mutase (PurE)-related protein
VLEEQHLPGMVASMSPLPVIGFPNQVTLSMAGTVFCQFYKCLESSCSDCSIKWLKCRDLAAQIIGSLTKNIRKSNSI